MTIVGLANRVDLNGCTGTLLEYMDSIKRWGVALPGEQVRVKPDNLVASNAGAELELYVKLSMDDIEKPKVYKLSANGANIHPSVEKKMKFLSSYARNQSSIHTHCFYNFPTLRQVERLDPEEIVTPMCFAIPDHIMQSAIQFLEEHMDHTRVIHFIGDVGIKRNNFEFESVPLGRWPFQKASNDVLLSKLPGFDVKKDGIRGVAKWSAGILPDFKSSSSTLTSSVARPRKRILADNQDRSTKFGLTLSKCD